MNYQTQPMQGLTPQPSISSATVNLPTRDAFLKDLRKKITLIIIGLAVLNTLMIGLMLLISSFVSLSYTAISEMEQKTGQYFSISAPADWQEVDGGHYMTFEFVDESGTKVSIIDVIATSNSAEYLKTTDQNVLKAYISDDTFLSENSLAQNPSQNCTQATRFVNKIGQAGFVRSCSYVSDQGSTRSEVAVLSVYDGESIWYVAEAIDPYWSENSLQFQTILSSLVVVK